MDFDREVGEAFDYQAATQALFEAVVVKAAEERNAAKRMAAEERGTRPRGWRRRQRGRQGRPRQRGRQGSVQGLRWRRHLRARAGAQPLQGLPLREGRSGYAGEGSGCAASRLWPHWRARRQRQQRSISSVQRSRSHVTLLVLNKKVGSLSSLKHARKKGNGGPTR
jgi:hypothetical protein